MRSFRTFVCDFETTVYENQTSTEVWAAACVELYTEDVQIFHSISEQFEYFLSLNCNVVAYYHNLKFDGSFWIWYLMYSLEYTQAVSHNSDNPLDVSWLKDRDMQNNSYKYSISDRGMWYTITIKVNNHYIELRDSLKLLPFSVRSIGSAFKTKHRKLEMEYKGFRYAGCEITPEEQEYIANDVLVVKEALEIMFDQGHTKLTIGACCLGEYKTLCNQSTKNQLSYDEMFPDLYSLNLTDSVHTYATAGDWIRKSYHGGWCYLVKGKENKLYHNGTTADVNSLYPSMMSSESGNPYPVGLPTFWSGNFIPDKALAPNRYFFIRVKTRFYIKPNMLPFIQIKGNYLYRPTECLETSDIYDPHTNEYYTHYTDKDGNVHNTRVELTLTMTDYKLILEHYELVDFEIIDGCYFSSQIGIFDDYIEKYKKIKLESKGALRTLAKLFLNNLYGKMASSTDSSFKYAFDKGNKTYGFYPVSEHNKKAGYIPVGSAITSYARNFTIRAAQQNYHGVDKAGFIYADTDSIHCDLPPEEIKGITVHDKNFCCWKLESCWDVAIFVRQKTYIEHITHEDLEPIPVPYNNIKCAGMPQTCKNLLNLSMMDTQCPIYNPNKYTKEELAFLFNEDHTPIHRTYNDFTTGLTVPSKLMPKRIVGGTLLVETTYEMK